MGSLEAIIDLRSYDSTTGLKTWRWRVAQKSFLQECNGGLGHQRGGRSPQNNYLGPLVSLGIKFPHIIAGTLRFRHDPLISTPVPNITASALHGHLLQLRLLPINRATLLDAPSLAASSPPSAASCFFYKRSSPTRWVFRVCQAC
jgi:hypothetical protein